MGDYTQFYDSWSDADWDALDLMRDAGERICNEMGGDVHDICSCGGLTDFYTSIGVVTVEDSLRNDPQVERKLRRAFWLEVAHAVRRRAGIRDNEPGRLF